VRALTTEQGRLLRQAAVQLIPAVTMQLLRDRFADTAIAQLLRISDRTVSLPETSVIEPFPGANGADLGAGWLNGDGSDFGNALTRVSNQVRATNVGMVSSAVRATAPEADQWAEVRIATWPTSGAAYREGGIVLRGSNPGTLTRYGVLAFFDTPTSGVYVQRWITSIGVPLGQYDGANIVSGDVLRASIRGRIIRVYKNDVLVLQVMDRDATALLSGSIGLSIYTDGATSDIAFDDFRGGNFREQYLGLLMAALRFGQRLGPTTPSSSAATLELLLTQLIAVLGRERFTDLIRHGLNQTGTYDIPLTEVAVELLLAKPQARTLTPAPIYDGFAYPDAVGLPSPWTAGTGVTGSPNPLQTVSGRVRASVVGVEYSTAHRDVLPMDQWAEFTLKTWGATGSYKEGIVILRAAEPPGLLTGYVLGPYMTSPGNLHHGYIGRVMAGTFVDLQCDTNTPPYVSTVPWGPGSRVRAFARGRELRLYHNDVLVLRCEDPAPLLVAGRIGMALWVDGALVDLEVDDFRGGELRPHDTWPEPNPRRLLLGNFRVAELTQATQETASLACQSRDAFLDVLIEGGTPGTVFVPLNIGNWWDDFEIELQCDGSVDGSPGTPGGMEDFADYEGPFSIELLIDFQRCAPADAEDVTRYYTKYNAVFRDLDISPGEILRVDWGQAFSETYSDLGGWVTGPGFTARVVVFVPPESQAELEAYRSGLVGQPAAPVVARVLATESFTHLQNIGSKDYAIEATDQFVGVILSDPTQEPGPVENDTIYDEVGADLSFP
jgi:hypothetical protein